MAEQTHRRTHRWAFPLGLLLIALAVVGAVSLGSMLTRSVKQWTQNPKEIQRYEEFLMPIVEHDPYPFDSVEKANTPQLLDISIWSLMRYDPDAERYLIDADDGYIIIPQADVEAEFKRLFGKELSTAMHTAIEGADYAFEYDPAAKVYRIPQTGTLAIYVPRVKSYRKVGNSVELEVQYLSYSTIDWADAPDGVPVRPDPMKTMLITLYVGEDGSFTVGSIQQQAGQQASALEALGSTRIQPPPETAPPAQAPEQTTETTTAAETTTEEK